MLLLAMLLGGDERVRGSESECCVCGGARDAGCVHMSKKRFGGHKAQQPGGGLSRVLLSEAFCGIDVLSHNFRRHFLDVLCVLYTV